MCYIISIVYRFILILIIVKKFLNFCFGKFLYIFVLFVWILFGIWVFFGSRIINRKVKLDDIWLDLMKIYNFKISCWKLYKIILNSSVVCKIVLLIKIEFK